MADDQQHTPLERDLIGVLEEMKAHAKETRAKITLGQVLNGSTALRHIEQEADCAIARAEESRA